MAMFTLFRATIKDYDVSSLADVRVGSIFGFVYFNSYLIINVTFLANLIIAQLAYAYKKYNRERQVHYLLSTLAVREVSEADYKYSSVVSVPFPLSILNLVFGSIVLAAKSPKLNLLLLHIYFLPVILVTSLGFMAYQIIILPFVYLKIVGHKWALLVSAGSSVGGKANDRFGEAMFFLVIGPLLLVLNCIVDFFWFFIHVYKYDLDRVA